MKASELIQQLQALPLPILVLIGIVVNQIMAIFVLSSVDDEEQHMLKWFDACPSQVVWFITMQLWPLTAFLWIRAHRKK